MFAVKLNEKVYNFFNEIILCLFSQHKQSDERATIANKTNAPVAAAAVASKGEQQWQREESRASKEDIKLKEKLACNLPWPKRKAQKRSFSACRQSMCARLSMCVCISVCVPVSVCCVCVYLHSLQMKFGSSFTFDFRSY